MKYYKLIIILFIFCGCDVSSISDLDSNNLSKLKVRISIQDGSKDHLLNELRVKLSDGKKQIINDKIKILLNGKPLDLYVKKELYYTKTSFYRGINLQRNDSYYFEIILPDSTKHPLAYIKPLKKSDSVKFYIPKKNSHHENVTLEWKNINTPTTLEVWKLVHNKKNSNEHSGGRYAASTIIDTINSRNGKYTISKSFFEDSLTVANYLQVRLNKQESGLLNPKLLKNSHIIYNYTIEKTIDVKKE